MISKCFKKLTDHEKRFIYHDMLLNEITRTVEELYKGSSKEYFYYENEFRAAIAEMLVIVRKFQTASLDVIMEDKCPECRKKNA